MGSVRTASQVWLTKERLSGLPSSRPTVNDKASALQQRPGNGKLYMLNYNENFKVCKNHLYMLLNFNQFLKFNWPNFGFNQIRQGSIPMYTNCQKTFLNKYQFWIFFLLSMGGYILNFLWAHRVCALILVLLLSP